MQVAGRQRRRDDRIGTGTKSYDDDTRFGDALTYRWDLDGDGLFDDAVGETPCVVFEDGSQARVVALEVTDAEGVTSVDMAVLSPLGGYCQDAAMSCRVGQDDPAYDDFVGLMEIEPDASGGFHVLVGPWIYPADVRVVSFDNQCGFVDEFVLDQNPHGFAVSPGGIIHVVDTPTATVRRFEVGGNELTSVALPTLPIEQSYQGQDVEIDPDGNLSIAVTEIEAMVLVEYAVHTIDNSGTLLRSVAAAADLGIDLASGEPIQTHEVGPDGSIYLLSNDALYRVTFDGQYALDLTIPLDDRFAWGNDVAAGADGTMYIANSNGVHRFLVDGTYDSSRTGSAGESFYDIQGIEVDCADRVYVAKRRYDAWVIQFADGGTPVVPPVIDDATVTLSRVFHPTTGTEDWVFTWETDVEGDPSLDRVHFGEVAYRCAPPYPLLTVANCDSSDVREAGDGFRHTLAWQDLPCTPRCSIPYYVESGVACYKGQSEWHMIKITICLKSM